MNQAETQQLLLSALFLIATVICAILFRTRARGTWFAPLVLVNCFLSALIFGSLAFFDISSWRAEVVGSMVRELPYYFVLSCVCLAQAGWRPAWPGLARTTGSEPVVSRPHLQRLLVSAPGVLLASWLLLGAAQMIWPTPALQSFAPAPPRFFFFSLLTSIPDGFYTGIVAFLFVLAARPKAPTRRLRLKNVFFAIGASAWFLMLINATVHAAERVILARPLLQTTTAAHLLLETALLLISIVAFAIGLAIRSAPVINSALIRRDYLRFIRLHERFESRRWHLVRGNKLRGLIRASYYASRAAPILRIGPDDTEKLTATIQLTAILSQPSVEAGEVTLEKARELLVLQTELLQDEDLACRLHWSKEWLSDPSKVETIGSAPLHTALDATLQLLGMSTSWSLEEYYPPLWYCLAAAVAADFGYVDPERIHADLGHRLAYRKSITAYTTAKDSARMLTAEEN